MKIGEYKKANLDAVIIINYMSAILMSLIISINKGVFRLINIDSFYRFIEEYKNVFLNRKIFSFGASAIWAFIVGCTIGPIFYLAIIQYNKSIVEDGMSIANTFMKLSVIIPILLFMIIWREYPSLIESIGIILCIIAIIVLNLDFKNMGKIKFNKSLILLIIYNGISQFAAKIYQKYGYINCKDLLTLFIFFGAFITSFIFWFKGGRQFNKNDIIFGLAIGIPNLLTTSFMVSALEYIDTSVAYLLSSVLSILIVLAIGVMFFKETLCKKDLFGVGLSIIAIIFINR